MAFAGTASGGVVAYLLGSIYSWYLFNDYYDWPKWEVCEGSRYFLS